MPAVAGTRVLVVDDDRSVREVVSAYLEREGLEVTLAKDGLEALELARSTDPHLVVLDLMLPKLDGLEVCRVLREERDVPVVMLTARGEELDRVLGLELGADDYVTKPFSPRELTARVKAVLRRSRKDAGGRPLAAADLTVDPTSRRVILGGQDVNLTALEFDLLLALMGSPGRVFTRDDLIERVWGGDYPGVDRVVDVHVSSLRRKIGGGERFISTVRGVGYRFNEAAG